ncbi:DUF1194 domain-containing protein [Flavimaricola marinus]|uniref:von Willebrand factor type A domain protein n=1 Tax=Flavimaricola marinus TaxID=1819565 RepID=A0A238LL54_9RHOB|nr:DUF1194 domain-containing protein [Flavimaricola marinus]SMY09600.1 hypothetical protein LOM8899_03770 [Flavimaricola marinus]
MSKISERFSNLARVVVSTACAWPALSASATACDTALLLAIDVSNSVDVAEYRLQVDGVADALLDPEIAETLVSGQVTLSLMQWSGVERQAMSIGWTQMRTAADVLAFSETARAVERAFMLSDTAPAEAVIFAIRQFEQVPDCARKVIDVSGDGTPNSGSNVRDARLLAERAGITINGIAIESLGVAITGFYQRALITRNGFVLTARGHRDYPRAIRNKILREISRVMG